VSRVAPFATHAACVRFERHWAQYVTALIAFDAARDSESGHARRVRARLARDYGLSWAAPVRS
jgi:hypothetical protein